MSPTGITLLTFLKKMDLVAAILHMPWRAGLQSWRMSHQRIRTGANGTLADAVLTGQRDISIRHTSMGTDKVGTIRMVTTKMNMRRIGTNRTMKGSTKAWTTIGPTRLAMSKIEATTANTVLVTTGRSHTLTRVVFTHRE